MVVSGGNFSKAALISIEEFSFWMDNYESISHHLTFMISEPYGLTS